MHCDGLAQLFCDRLDRILISQSLHHGLMIATVDNLVRAYPIPIVE